MVILSDNLERLRQAPIFEGLDEESLKILEQKMELRTVPAGETLFHKGDPGDEIPA